MKRHSTKSATRKGTAPPLQNDLHRGWRLVPVFGLRVTGDGADPLSSPLWGDATLLSVEAAERLVESTVAPGKAKEFVQGLPVSALIKDWSPNLPPRENLVELVPTGYIGVRRGTDTDASNRAGTVCAFLTACMFLRGHRTTAFTLRGDLATWSVLPGQVFANREAENRAAVSKTIRLNEHLAINPVAIDVGQARRSWQSGESMPLPNGTHWDIHGALPISRALMADGPMSPFRKSLVAVAEHLNETCAAPAYETQAHMAVTALEMLFGTNEFKRVEALACQFFQGDAQHARIKRLFSARHEFIHQGRRPTGDTMKQVARDGLLFAWLLLDAAAVHLDHFKLQADYVSFIQSQVELSSIVDRLKRLGINTVELEKGIGATIRLPVQAPSFAISKKSADS